jgi:hypothetical protein
MSLHHQTQQAGLIHLVIDYIVILISGLLLAGLALGFFG